VIKSRRVVWVGKVAYVGKPMISLFERLIYKWKDEINMNAPGIGCENMNWIELTQDWD
jgi:hypothetical protein